jgi:hypothetical protein
MLRERFGLGLSVGGGEEYVYEKREKGCRIYV